MRTSGRQHAVRILSGLFFVIGLGLSFTGGTASAETGLSPLLKGMSRDEVLRLGEAMYQQGKLPSGEFMQAVVKGDIPVDGAMFTCVSCHLRSGFGVGEGQVRTPPIDGSRLYAPLSKFKGIPRKGRLDETAVDDVYRPAYTDETLATVMRTGVDPAGRTINDIMPLYLLDDRDTAILVYYMKNLSTGPQPGVTDTTLRFATVIADEVSPEVREAVVGPLQAYFRNWRIPKSMERSIRAEAGIMEGTPRALRKSSLAVWELHGPSETWRKQLEDYYRKDPVFVIITGITNGDWAPIHDFCEDNRIPSVFPLTEYPVISETDWYTQYLSKGLYQEGEAAARYVNERADGAADRPIVQIVRKGRPGLALSHGFSVTWRDLGNAAPETVELDAQTTVNASFWKRLMKNRDRPVLLLWLDAADLASLDTVAASGSRPAMIIISASQQGQKLFSLPDAVRQHVYITYPYQLSMAPRVGRSPVTSSPGPGPGIGAITAGVGDVKLKMQHVFAAISEPLARLRSFVYREYFLEMIEKLPDQTLSTAAYPRLSFGPGQRYASKGCYIVQLSGGPDPKLIRKSDWVIH
ncbi:MAG: ABC transporter substrate-binding protein [Nitrospirota bacterium]